MTFLCLLYRDSYSAWQLLDCLYLSLVPNHIIDMLFQITTKRINFIVDEHNNDNLTEDAFCSNAQSRETENDRSWWISSLHHMFSRRWTNLLGLPYLFFQFTSCLKTICSFIWFSVSYFWNFRIIDKQSFPPSDSA